MRTSGLFETTVFDAAALPTGGRFTIVPFGDLHFGCHLHAKERFNEFCNRYRRRKDCYYIGMGDYLDVLSARERKGYGAAEFHETTVSSIESGVSSAIKALLKKLDFMRGRCLGLIDGNHYFAFKDGTTSVSRLADGLECPFLGVMAAIRINTKFGGSRLPVDIIAHHGKGAGQLAGATINSLEKLSHVIVPADIYIMGDDHALGTWPITRVETHYNTKNRGYDIIDKDVILARSGSFLFGYVKGTASYIVEKALKPRPIGNVEIQVSMKTLRHNKTKVRKLKLVGSAHT